MRKFLEKIRERYYRTRLIGFFLLMTTLLVLVGFFNYYTLKNSMANSVKMYEECEQITLLYQKVGTTQNNFELYMSNLEDKIYAKQFYEDCNTLRDECDVFLQERYYNMDNIRTKNLANMIISYTDLMNDTVFYKKTSRSDYKDKYMEVNKVYNYIKEYTKSNMSNELMNSTKEYSDIREQIINQEKITWVFYIVVVGVIIVAICMVCRELTIPIEKLAKVSKSVANDPNEICETKLSLDRLKGEIELLYKDFNKMIDSRNKSIIEAEKQKNEIAMLHVHQVRNLDMEKTLKEAELRALQAQVKPHFIFNTLNIGVNIARLNDDIETSEYLEDAADVIRYNLRGLDSVVSIEEEINNASSYMNLLKKRFEDLVNFELDVEDKEVIKNIYVPKMTLQPLVENAYIHGISKYENGGTILIKTRKRENVFFITIGNTGKPIEDKFIQKILYCQNKEGNDSVSGFENKQGGHTTGIGLNNVIKRLKMHFKVNDVIDITYENGMNQFTIKIPLRND